MLEVEKKDDISPDGMSDENKDNLVDPVLEEMFRAGIHFGYSRSRRHPKMQKYIFGLRNNVQVFDLQKVKAKMETTFDFLKHVIEEKKTILFVGTKPPIAGIVEEAAVKSGMPYINVRWPGGLLTNFGELLKRRNYILDLKSKKSAGELDKYTKKEQLDFDEEIEKFENKFLGIIGLQELPGALVVIDSKEEKTAVREAKGVGIPVVGISNIDCDPEEIDHIIPANDSAPSSVKYILEKLSEMIVGAKESVLSESKEENGKEESLVENKDK